jgi:hypothetical protein
LNDSCSIRVSNELGAGHPRAARLAVYVVVVIALIESILVGTVMILIRNICGYAYSNEEEVVKYVATMMPILAVSNFLDGLQCVLSGFFFCIRVFGKKILLTFFWKVQEFFLKKKYRSFSGNFFKICFEFFFSEIFFQEKKI